mmetsp:Transcript_32994/g.50518  ORF Transcript_32994/g.50518 Transcript_32994/m.50518 type:complete len:82 (-) Transcript_32994:452-697(-)
MAVFSESKTTPSILRYILLAYYLLSSVCEVAIFFSLICLMKRLHYYEYKANRKSMILQITWAVAYRVILIINLQFLLFINW